MVKSYDIGYGRPPRHAQFRPGQSGNPRGRSRGSRNLRSDLEDELNQRIVVTTQGKKRSISRQQALVKTLVTRALQADGKSVNALLGLMLRLLPLSDDQAVEVDLSESDKAILEAYEKRVRRAAKHPATKEK